MMIVRTAVIAVLVGACSFGVARGQASAPTLVWNATGGLDAPESAFLDTASNTLFVSLIVGTPAARDGNGRIAKLTPDGAIVATDWVTGLNAPKGLRADKGTLWTADLDEVIGISIASGKITSRVKIADAKFLNDVALGPDGTVYVTDTMTNRVYAVSGGSSSVLVEGGDLLAPNGLLFDGGRLIVGTMGGGPDKQPGRLFAIDLKSKTTRAVTSQAVGAIDGIESDGRNGYIVTDIRSSKVLHVSASGEVRDLLQLAGGAADLAVVPARRLAIVPHLNENRVAAYDISAALK